MDEKSGEQLQVKPCPSVEQPATSRHRQCLAGTPAFARSTLHHRGLGAVECTQRQRLVTQWTPRCPRNA